jgi:hypothetical protein
MAEPPRRFPAPWRVDRVPGGYIVRDANGQALAYVYSRDNEAEARQAKVLTRLGGSPPTSRGCRSYWARRIATEPAGLILTTLLGGFDFYCTRSNCHASIQGVRKSPKRARTQHFGPSGVARSSMSTMTPVAPQRTCGGLYRSRKRTLMPTRRGMTR